MECIIDGCALPAKTRKMCIKHYTRVIRYGDPEKVLTPRGEAAKFFNEMLQVDHDDCVAWPFTTCGSKDKRPWIKHKGKRGMTARFLCIERNGPPPTPTHHAAHKCGNGWCVNSRHLYWATPKENAADKLIHGTVARGERQGSHKLKESDVRAIRDFQGKLSSYEVARLYDVESRQIRRIWDRTRWGWLT